jgi:hypothetical protein
MSFRLFVYYCAVAGGWAALIGWGVGTALARAANVNPVASSWLVNLLLGTSLGAFVGLGVGAVDGVWSSGGRYLAQALTAVTMRGLIAAGIGLLAGLAGTGLGLFLVTVLSRASDHFLLVGLGTVVGWALLGLLIGASVGLYEVLARMTAGAGQSGAVRKLFNGLAGGAVGGLIGGLLFLVARGVLGLVLKREADELFSANAWGFVALGLCIGLLIGLAQVILKEAWVKVEAGFRPGRELMLIKDEYTIGRGEGCDIGLFGDQGVERLHARIFKKGDRFLVADAGTPGGTFVNDERVSDPRPLHSGDAVRLGHSVLRFGERQKRKT